MKRLIAIACLLIGVLSCQDPGLAEKVAASRYTGGDNQARPIFGLTGGNVPVWNGVNVDYEPGALDLSNSNSVQNALGVVNGGTGATTQQGAITALTDAGSAPAGDYLRTDGTNAGFSLLLASDLSGTVSVSHGGTGASTQQGAINDLTDAGKAPAGDYLRTDGTNAGFSALLASDLSGQVSVSNGGTGASTQQGAINDLTDAGSAASGTYLRDNGTNAGFSSILSADLPVIPVDGGGTGAQNPNGALTNLLPSQSGNGGKFLETDGSTTYWNTSTSTTSLVFDAGTFSLPTCSGGTPQMYFSNDSAVGWACDGTTWHPLLGGGLVGTQPPAAATFGSVNNDGGATIADSAGCLLIKGVNDGAGPNMRGFTLGNDSGTASVQATLWPFSPSPGSAISTENPDHFVGLRESSSGKMYGIGFEVAIGTVGTDRWKTVGTTYKWTSNSAFTQPQTFTVGSSTPGAQLVFRVRRNSSTVFTDWQVGLNSNNWQTIGSDALTDAFTTAPDQVIIGTNGQNAVPVLLICHFANLP